MLFDRFIFETTIARFSESRSTRDFSHIILKRRGSIVLLVSHKVGRTPQIDTLFTALTVLPIFTGVIDEIVFLENVKYRRHAMEMILDLSSTVT